MAEKRYKCAVCGESVPGESAREAHEATDAHLEAATAPTPPPPNPDEAEKEPSGEQPPPAPEAPAPPDDDPEPLPAEDPPAHDPVTEAPAPAAVAIAGVMCDVEGCESGPFTTMQEIDAHKAGDAHRLLQRKVVRAGEEERRAAIKARVDVAELADDLKALVLAFDMPKDLRAKKIRQAFAFRGWPDLDHLGSVRDFMDEWSMPYTSTPQPAPRAPAKAA